ARGNAVRSDPASWACITSTDICASARYIPVARPVRAFAVAPQRANDREQMTGTTQSSEGLDARRRKLLFRCWHRGMRELDLIMGRFADSAIAGLGTDDLAALERLLEVPDRELLAWVTGEIEVPPAHDTALFRRLRDFNHSGAGAR